MPLDSTLTTSDTPQLPEIPPLMISCPSGDPTPRVPRAPLRRTAHNPHARKHNYSLVDDLAQSLIAMSVLEVFQACHLQRNALLSTLGEVDPSDSHLNHF
jgi:hypothetical protein